MKKITLNDGTVLNRTFAVLEDDGLWIHIMDNTVTMQDAFMLLIDPNKTSTITANADGSETVYNGYTELVSIRIDCGSISAGLRKPYEA